MSIADVVKGFHDVTIVAKNVAELRRFYQSLGFRQVVDQGDDLAVFLVGSNELAIHTSSTHPTNALVLSVLVESLEPVQQHAATLGIQLAPPAPLRPGLIGVARSIPTATSSSSCSPRLADRAVDPARAREAARWSAKARGKARRRVVERTNS